MPLRITSRYRTLGVHEAPDASGMVHPTVPIRRHEPQPGQTVTYQHRVTGAEDIEYLAWRFLGDGESWWRIADENPVRFPLDLRPGDAVAIASREDVGLVVRERSFR
jgi:hypothetical protein